jgi:hypothetical protein
LHEAILRIAPMPSRRARLVLAWISTATAAGVVASWFLRDPSRTVFVDRDAPPKAAATPGTLAGAPAALRREGFTVDSPAVEAAPDGGARSEGDRPTISAIGWIEAAVTIGGRPADEVHVYAVPADGSGDVPTPFEGRPSGFTNAAGIARIGVPRAGRYDVGADQDASNTWALGVAVAPGATARASLAMPATAPVDVEVDTDGVSIEACWVRAFAEGRRGTPPWSGVYPLPQERRVRVDLPTGVRFRFGLDAQARGRPVPEIFEPTPETIVPPGRVVFRHVPTAWSRVLPSFVVDGRVPPTTRRSALHFRWTSGPGSNVVDVERVIRWNTGRAERLDADLPLFPLAIEGGRLAWSGDAVVPEESAVAGAGAGERKTQAVAVRIRADLLSAGLEGIDVLGGPDPLPEDACVHLHTAGGTDGDGTSLELPANDDELARLSGLSPTTTAVLETEAWWTSEPTRIPPSGRARLRLVPAGYLLVVLREIPRPETGGISLRRADGAWLGTRRWEDIAEDAGEAKRLEDVGPGTLVGPLPEGDVPLVVLVGGIETARVVGRVTARRITPLELR